MTQKRKIIVIGGSASGPKAAAKARRIDNNAEVVIMQKEVDLSMASCGYSYYVGGFFNDRNMLLCTPTLKFGPDLVGKVWEVWKTKMAFND